MDMSSNVIGWPAAAASREGCCVEQILRIENLKKYFKTSKGLLHAVDDVSLSISRGETLGVVGESGCGKSTLGRAVLRLTEPTAGQVFFENENILSLRKKELRSLRSRMQIIFQDPYSSLNPRMTVGQIIAEPLLIMKMAGTRAQLDRKVAELMETVGLSGRLVNAYPHELDGGRRQRIGVARALSVSPRFIVCDEPVSALDVSIQAQILNLLMDLQRDMGLTYLFIMHDMSVVKHISNHIAVMYLGQCVELCPSDELFASPLHPYTQALLSAIPIPSSSQYGRKQQVLSGEVTSPIDPKPGCRFAPRCPHACPSCTEKELMLQEVSKGHFVLCAKAAEAAR